MEARERVQLTYPALTPAYLKGVNVVFARACDLSFDRACLQCCPTGRASFA